MISHKHKCIFIHIPKCAGTSFENVLGHFDGHEGREGQDHRSIRMIQQPYKILDVVNSLDNLKDYIRRQREYFRNHANPNNKLTCSAEEYESYYKFTIVRNPWMRAHSWYRNAMRDEVHQKNYGYPSHINFTEFMKEYAGKGYLRPQTYWLKQFDGQINMDFIGKFESIDSAYRNVMESLSIKNIGELPHKIEGQKSNYKEDFTEEVIRFISEYYKEEIDLFDYDFNLDNISEGN